MDHDFLHVEKHSVPQRPYSMLYPPLSLLIPLADIFQAMGHVQHSLHVEGLETAFFHISLRYSCIPDLK